MFIPHLKIQKNIPQNFHDTIYMDVGISNSYIYAIRIMLATKYVNVFFSKQKYTLSTAKKSIKVAYIICLKQRIGKHVGGIFL